eukprot:1144614-Pelagomonas_calceolata.AAC.8
MSNPTAGPAPVEQECVRCVQVPETSGKLQQGWAIAQYSKIWQWGQHRKDTLQGHTAGTHRRDTPQGHARGNEPNYITFLHA